VCSVVFGCINRSSARPRNKSITNPCLTYVSQTTGTRRSRHTSGKESWRRWFVRTSLRFKLMTALFRGWYERGKDRKRRYVLFLGYCRQLLPLWRLLGVRRQGGARIRWIEYLLPNRGGYLGICFFNHNDMCFVVFDIDLPSTSYTNPLSARTQTPPTHTYTYNIHTYNRCPSATGPSSGPLCVRTASPPPTCC